MKQIILLISIGFVAYEGYEQYQIRQLRAELFDLSIKLCAPYKPAPIGPTNVLYCQCSKSEKQKPNKCEDKYK